MKRNEGSLQQGETRELGVENLLARLDIDTQSLDIPVIAISDEAVDTSSQKDKLNNLLDITSLDDFM